MIDDPLKAFGGSQPGRSGKPDSSKPLRSVILSRRLSDVEPEEVTYVWPGRIPRGKLTLIVGDPGVGKSFLTLDVAARISSGTPWPDRPDENVEAGNVVIFSAEDDPADTIRPRLDAAGADVGRIHVADGVQRRYDGGVVYLNLGDDIDAVEQFIVDTGAGLCIVDPISAYLAGSDSHNNSDIREVLGPLAAVAARQGCAMLTVTHLNKSSAGRAMYRAIGSIGFMAAARIAWAVVVDPDDDRRRLMLPLKSNLIEKPTGLAFEIVDGVLRWDPTPVTADADSVLSVRTGDRNEVDRACQWLTELLANGSMAVHEIENAAQREGLSWRTVERAKKHLNIWSKRGGFGRGAGYLWLFPSGDSGTMDRQP